MKKDLLLIAIIVGVVAFICANVEIKSVDEYYSCHPDAVTEDSEFVTLTIECDDIILNGYTGEDIPEDGIIIPETKFVLLENETVFDVMSKALNSQRIQFDHSGGKNVYVKGIDGIYEFDYGTGSGWQYTVNGVSPEINCGDYKLESGDEIVFYYTCDYRKEGTK